MNKIKAVTPRLSDEDPDPLEQDELDNSSTSNVEGWLPWDSEDIIDIRRLIYDRMPIKQKEIFNAFLDGRSHTDLHLSEKYWRYHFAKGIEFIKKELKL
jgi:hypothetical protein